MKFESWVGLIHASAVFIGFTNGQRIVRAFFEKAGNSWSSIRKHSRFFRGTHKIRDWFEAIRKRRNRAFWEAMDRRWGKAIESGIILTIALMPVLNAWEVLLGLTSILAIIRFPERKSPETGLLFFWLALAISAIMAMGSEGLARLSLVTVWLLIAGLAGRTFSAEFSRRVIRFCLISGLFWMVIGLWQQSAGVPTPAGWLEPGQNWLISVRSYSVFGNPNIYGIYLLSILCFAFLEINAGDRFYRAAAWLILPLVLASLFFTYSRTAWLLGFVAGVYWAYQKLSPGKRWYLSLGILLLMVIPGFRARITGPSNLLESTFGLRVEIWRTMLKILAGFWQWGAGPGSFIEVYCGYPLVSGPVQHGHQLYLQLWLENGIISLFALVRVIVKSLAGFTGFHSAAKTVALVIVVFLIFGMFETWWVHQFSGGYFWLLTGMLHSLRAGRIDS